MPEHTSNGHAARRPRLPRRIPTLVARGPFHTDQLRSLTYFLGTMIVDAGVKTAKVSGSGGVRPPSAGLSAWEDAAGPHDCDLLAYLGKVSCHKADKGHFLALCEAWPAMEGIRGSNCAGWVQALLQALCGVERSPIHTSGTSPPPRANLRAGVVRLAAGRW